MHPSANPENAGKTYGVNAAENWVYLYNDMLDPTKKREVVTIYKLDAIGQQTWAKVLYNFAWTPQTDRTGKVHPTIDYPGLIVDHSNLEENHYVLKDVRVPARLHFGTMGVASREGDIVDSVPPSLWRECR